jgi:hypothetical protein
VQNSSVANELFLRYKFTTLWCKKKSGKKPELTNENIKQIEHRTIPAKRVVKFVYLQAAFDGHKPK